MSSWFFQFMGDMGKFIYFVECGKRKVLLWQKEGPGLTSPKRRERMPSRSAEECTLLRPAMRSAVASLRSYHGSA